jgi:hypothetical protein
MLLLKPQNSILVSKTGQEDYSVEAYFAHKTTTKSFLFNWVKQLGLSKLVFEFSNLGFATSKTTM